MPKVVMQKIGRWNDLYRLPLTLQAVKGVVSEGLREAGNEYVDMLVHAIENQTLPWVNLTDSWAEYKETHDLDPRTWISTGLFLDSLKNSKVQRAGKSYLAGLYVNALHDTPHSGTTLTMSQLAIFHEFGSPKMNIPARPLFRPVAEVWEEKFKKQFIVKIWREVNVKLPI